MVGAVPGKQLTQLRADETVSSRNKLWKGRP